MRLHSISGNEARALPGYFNVLLERYIAFRVENRIGTFPETESATYRGLRPGLPLFITRKGAKFELNVKRRILETGEYREYLAADSLQSYITRRYAKAGIKGGSSQRTAHIRYPAVRENQGHGHRAPPSRPRLGRLFDALYRVRSAHLATGFCRCNLVLAMIAHILIM